MSTPAGKPRGSASQERDVAGVRLLSAPTPHTLYAAKELPGISTINSWLPENASCCTRCTGRLGDSLNPVADGTAVRSHPLTPHHKSLHSGP